MSPCTSADVIRKFAMALRGQSLDEYNAEDNHTRHTAEKQVENALQLTGFVMGTPLVPNRETPRGPTGNCTDVAGPWPSLFSVHPSVTFVIDREGDLWRRLPANDWNWLTGSDWSWQLFDKKLDAWRFYELPLDRTSFFAPFTAVETTGTADTGTVWPTIEDVPPGVRARAVDAAGNWNQRAPSHRALSANVWIGSPSWKAHAPSRDWANLFAPFVPAEAHR